MATQAVENQASRHTYTGLTTSSVAERHGPENALPYLAPVSYWVYFHVTSEWLFNNKKKKATEMF